MRHPRSRYFRDPSKDTRPQSETERLKRLPEGDVSDQRRLHVERLKRGFCSSNGVCEPSIRFVKSGMLRRLKGADGVALRGKDGKPPTILVEAGQSLAKTLTTVAHELYHTARWQKGKGGGTEAEAERIGREVANRYLAESRKHVGPGAVEL